MANDCWDASECAIWTLEGDAAQHARDMANVANEYICVACARATSRAIVCRCRGGDGAGDNVGYCAAATIVASACTTF